MTGAVSDRAAAVAGRVLWVDASNGAAGDMLLAALLDAGADPEPVRAGLARLPVEALELDLAQVRRHGFRASHVTVRAPESRTVRGLAQVLDVIRGAGLPEPVREFAEAVFGRLAAAEARVHGVPVAEVHFHEVGALDAIADVVGTGLALHELALLAGARRVVSPVAVGQGMVVGAAHGRLPVPPPAVLELLTGANAPIAAHPGQRELCTPTGAALLATLADEWGGPPACLPRAVGVGAGTADPDTHPNLLRVLIGEPVMSVYPASSMVAAVSMPAESSPAADVPAPVADDVSPGGDVRTAAGDWLVQELCQVETTIDDLDPRIWPDLLERLRAVGAADAWCAPVLMRKGRPGQVLTVLVDPARLDLVCRLIVTHTGTLGMRVTPVRRRALRRDQIPVEVSGGTVSVKRGWLDGQLVTAQPEFDDAARLSEQTGRPIAEIISAARCAAVQDPHA